MKDLMNFLAGATSGVLATAYVGGTYPCLQGYTYRGIPTVQGPVEF